MRLYCWFKSTSVTYTADTEKFSATGSILKVMVFGRQNNVQMITHVALIDQQHAFAFTPFLRSAPQVRLESF